MGTDTESVINGQNTENNNCTDSPSMEGPSMVPSIVGSTKVLPQTDTSTGDHNNTGPHCPGSSEGSGHTTSGMAHIRESLRHRELSKEATELFMASWRKKSQSNYNSLLLKWECWCTKRDRDPIIGPIDDIANFLAELYQEGYAYRSLNSYRSAISAVHEKVDGYPIGQHPLVTRVLKGAFNNRPPQPRYKSTWKVAQVIEWLDQQENKDIPLLMLAMKAVTLCAMQIS